MGAMRDHKCTMLDGDITAIYHKRRVRRFYGYWIMQALRKWAGDILNLCQRIRAQSLTHLEGGSSSLPVLSVAGALDGEGTTEEEVWYLTVLLNRLTHLRSNEGWKE